MERPDIDTVLEEAELIEKMYMDLLDGTTQRRMKHIDDGSTGLQNVEYKICVINSANQILQNSLMQKYTGWYETCRGFIQQSAGAGRRTKDKEFADLYETIVSLINLRDSTRSSNEKNHLRKEFIACFDIQFRIIRTVKPLVSSLRSDEKRLAAAELVNSEIEYAESLYAKGSFSLAGASAINALEIYLTILCKENKIEISPEDTIAAMIRKIHESGMASEFSPEMFRKAEYIAALGNKCISPGNLQEDEVRELIDKIREMTFLAFY